MANLPPTPGHGRVYAVCPIIGHPTVQTIVRSGETHRTLSDVRDTVDCWMALIIEQKHLKL